MKTIGRFLPGVKRLGLGENSTLASWRDKLPHLHGIALEPGHVTLVLTGTTADRKKHLLGAYRGWRPSRAGEHRAMGRHWLLRGRSEVHSNPGSTGEVTPARARSKQ